ncbi:MAG: hypothetical protein WDW36_009498 [Sanguina aurantia]
MSATAADIYPHKDTPAEKFNPTDSHSYSIQGEFPCKEFTCKIQTCLAMNDYQQRRCAGPIQDLVKCCQKVPEPTLHCMGFGIEYTPPKPAAPAVVEVAEAPVEILVVHTPVEVAAPSPAEPVVVGVEQAPVRAVCEECAPAAAAAEVEAEGDLVVCTFVDFDMPEDEPAVVVAVEGVATPEAVVSAPQAGAAPSE